MNSAMGPLLAFAAVVALIPIALWLLRRTPIGGGAGSANAMRSVAVLPLSTSQRLVTVEVGAGEERRWLVLGVTPSSITTLHTMAPGQAAPPPPTPLPAGFAQMLKKVRGDA